MSEVNNLNQNILFLNGEINSETSQQIINYLLLKEFQKDSPKHVKLVINSEGGMVNQALAIIDVIDSLSYPVYTYGIGIIYSAALLIMMNGAKGHRHLFKNTSILSHTWWSEGYEGSAHDFKAMEVENALTTKKVFGIYEKCTGQNKDIIENKLMTYVDTYLSPEQAIGYGLADKIITNLKLDFPKTNIIMEKKNARPTNHRKAKRSGS